MSASPQTPTGPAVAGPYVDLHTHSTASDGAFAPADVVAHASKAGLASIALTDHDSVSGVEEARAAGERLGVEVIAGIELSAVDGSREIHLLGLHLQSTAPIDRELAVFRETRVTRAEEMVARLNKLDVPVTFDAVLAEAGEGAVGRPHVARAIVRGGWVRDQREAFDRFLGNGRPAFVAKHHLAIGDAIRLVHDAGGVAVVAHPGPDGTRARIEPLVALGLDGLEVRHPSHSAEDAARLGALVDHFGLVPSGGSDWHGAVEGPRVIGNQRVSADWAARQAARAAELRAARVTA
ncbi:MAG TPA: PHP domain-containing protein [Gemmatimonadaceae bacterium]|nr:PHP domain-containing protein [Gemmatimonadaceae bacterium]